MPWIYTLKMVVSMFCMGFPGGALVKNLPANAGDPGSIPGSGRSPGEGNGHPLQYSCLDIPWTEEPGGLQSMGSQGIRHDRAHMFCILYYSQQQLLGNF